MKEIIYLTGNKYKFEVAQKALDGLEITLTQKDLEVPEIQSTEVEDVASFSAKWAAQELNMPVTVTDAGYYIESLNGFPGPFIKYVNQWLTSDDLLHLMEGKENRAVTVRTCLAYCEPGKEPVTFQCSASGTIAHKSVRTDKEDITPVNEIFIPEGFDRVETEIPREEMIDFWAKTEDYWKQLADHLATQYL